MAEGWPLPGAVGANVQGVPVTTLWPVVAGSLAFLPRLQTLSGVGRVLVDAATILSRCVFAMAGCLPDGIRREAPALPRWRGDDGDGQAKGFPYR